MIRHAAETLDLDAPKLFLSHLAGAGFLLRSRNNQKVKDSAWQSFAANKALRAKERISPSEMRVLSEISRLGRVRSERQLLFVLKTIRLAFEDDRNLW